MCSMYTSSSVRKICSTPSELCRLLKVLEHNGLMVFLLNCQRENRLPQVVNTQFNKICSFLKERKFERWNVVWERRRAATIYCIKIGAIAQGTRLDSIFAIFAWLVAKILFAWSNQMQTHV